ncbi:MAG: restriction endonuclease [Gammaproteobacteria bacterium]
MSFDEIFGLISDLQNSPYILYFAAGFFALLLIYRGWRHIRRWWRAPHRWRLRQARAILDDIKGSEASEGAVRRLFGRLRAVDPFVFEELVLEAFRRRGLRVKRNKRYTGDGGIDGRIHLRGEVLVQSKRYKKHINPEHVKTFVRLVERQRTRGLFVHTGKTGGASWEAAGASQRVTIVSGKGLIALVFGLPLKIFGQKL